MLSGSGGEGGVFRHVSAEILRPICRSFRQDLIRYIEHGGHSLLFVSGLRSCLPVFRLSPRSPDTSSWSLNTLVRSQCDCA